jgi:YNFM family putative membrane transporter
MRIGVKMLAGISNDARVSQPPQAVKLGVIGLMAFLTVVDLFATQALLPAIAAHYQVMPSAAGLAVNACTLGMAAGGLIVALYGQHIGQRRGIIASLLILAVLTLLLAISPNLWIFAGLRILQGLCMASAFGLTLAYLGEAFTAEATASAFAAYITGNVASNLIGRLLAAAVTSHAGLPGNFVTFAALNVAGAGLAYVSIPRMPRVPHSAATAMKKSAAWTQHLAQPDLRAVFGIGFCILFAFIGTFTYVNFVLVAPPHSVGMMTLGVIYFVFLPSILSTPLAGKVAGVVGHERALRAGLVVALLGLPLLVQPSLASVLLGMTLVAAGTFFAQALATGFVGRMARGNPAAASGLYLASYFAGGLAGSAILGQIFDRFGWTACVLGIGCALIAALILSLHLTAKIATAPA